MAASSKRPFEGSNHLARKKCKVVVEFDVGECSDRSSVLHFCVCGSKFMTAPRLAVGLQPKELIQRVQEITQLVVPEIGTRTDVRMSFRKESDNIIAVDWSELDEDVLVRIAENHLHSADDFAVFSSVCRSWYQAAAACDVEELNKNWIQDQVPWLMLTDGNTEVYNDRCTMSDFVLPRVLNDIEEYDNDRDCVQALKGSYGRRSDFSRGVVDMKSHKRYDIICREGCGRVCWGSPYGWIVTAGGDGKMFMFDPVTKSHIDLPSFGTFRWRWGNEDDIRSNSFVTKVVVLNVGGDGDVDVDAQSSWAGVDDDLRVVAFYGNDHVALVKPGNRRWVEIEGEARTYSPLTDVTYDSNIGLIFVDNSGGLLCCDVPAEEESPFLKWFQPPVQSIHDENHNYQDYIMTYIVKCGDELLMVTRFIDYDYDSSTADNYRVRGYFFVDYYMTVAIVVRMYDFEEKTWVSCNGMEDVALFVGNNTSMWADEPGCGSIYFTDDLRKIYHKTKYKLGGHDYGVYNFKRRQIEHYLYGANQRSSYCCPLFFKPSICVPKGLN